MPPERPHESGARLIQSVDRAAALLEAIATAKSAPSLAALADSVGLNRSTAWRLLATLERRGWVERDAERQNYTIGYTVSRIGGHVDPGALVRRAHPLVAALAAECGRTVTLTVPRHATLTTVDQVDGPVVLSPTWIGRDHPLHVTSDGKCLLAHMPPAELDVILGQPLRAFTSRSITDPARLRGELNRVRQQGYAVGRGEFEQGMNGVAVPVFAGGPRPVAFLGAYGVAEQLGSTALTDLAKLVQGYAERLTNELSR